MASSQNFFLWFQGVLICQLGLIPCRTKSGRVSDPAEQDPAGYQTPCNSVLRGIRPHGTKSCGVSDPAEQWQSCVHFIADTCSARSDTPQNNILQGLILRLKKFLKTPQNNIKIRIFLQLRNRIQKYSRV
jgi:hypothetical protein